MTFRLGVLSKHQHLAHAAQTQLPSLFHIALETAKKRRSVRLLVGAPAEMETRSKTLDPGAAQIVNPRDDVEVVYSFPAGNAWGRVELKLLNVNFVYQVDRELRSLSLRCSSSIKLADAELEQRIVLVGLTDVCRDCGPQEDIGDHSSFGFSDGKHQ